MEEPFLGGVDEDKAELGAGFEVPKRLRADGRVGSGVASL